MPEYSMRRQEPSGWAIGFTGFAAFTMMLVGFFHAIVGLAGIVSNEFVVSTPNYIFRFDATAWGWVHLILGIVVVIAGLALFSGAVWARTIGVILAALSAIANFAFLPHYPLWSTLIIAVDIAVIWALTTHGHDISFEE